MKGLPLEAEVEAGRPMLAGVPAPAAAAGAACAVAKPAAAAAAVVLGTAGDEGEGEGNEEETAAGSCAHLMAKFAERLGASAAEGK
mmetsp:Transcript_27412/g.59561  ORF Transcript_27412/g.59561 Transcript_27412/m.59561 type:complete len:86 (+) Transcript_27412:2114-2371(+)